ncbi:MAG: type II toxin-antitoxin system Phd/YefM family antitoxin [Gammaproteobacteria bacterium]|nr:type II toxin-antitoxin system Phd/YefM family antitoxin [Gammaproteobacteria bacterium]
MKTTTLSSRELNQDVGGAKRAANEGPVFITDRGKPAHVLLNIEDYRRLVGGKHTLGEALAMPEGANADLDIDFEPRKMDISLRIPDFGEDE